jgi:hypothetical protein
VARHFGTELGTPKPAVFALEAATSVRSSSLVPTIAKRKSIGFSSPRLHKEAINEKRVGIRKVL